VSVRQESICGPQVRRSFVIVRFTVKTMRGILRGMCLGISAELASGWKGAYATWPLGMVRNKALEYFENARLCGEHHYAIRTATPLLGCIAFLGAAGAGVDSIGQLTVSSTGGIVLGAGQSHG